MSSVQSYSIHILRNSTHYTEEYLCFQKTAKCEWLRFCTEVNCSISFRTEGYTDLHWPNSVSVLYVLPLVSG